MASTNSTIDGMGFEEMSQVGSVPYSTWIAGSFTAENHIATNTYFTTPGSVFAVDGVFTGSVTSSDGRIRTASVENATELFGYRVKAGSVVIGNSASGLVHFKTDFADANWFMAISPRNMYDPYKYAVTDHSGLVPMVSGIRRASGCWIYGGSCTVMDWIAVGR